MFAIFVSSILLSAILIVSFVAFVFKLGLFQSQGDYQGLRGSESMLSQFEMFNSPIIRESYAYGALGTWSGRLGLGTIQGILHEESKFFSNI